MKILALIAVASACGDKHVDPEVLEVNAFVPANHKDDLDFVMREVDEVLPKQMWKVPAPKSWDVSNDGGRISSRHDRVNGSLGARVGSFIAVSTENCAGDCSPTPHALDSEYQKIMHERDKDIEMNGKRLHQRIRRWTERFEAGAVHINVATWASERPTYRFCEARLEPELADAQEAFEAACVLAATY